jgi:hypothetical protein
MKTESNGTQSLVKIIRDRVGSYAWDSNNVNDWTTSSLNTLLNSGTLYETYIKAYDDLFESVTWGLGAMTSSYTSSTGATGLLYTDERGTYVYKLHEKTWTGKIALMYPSDYGYATSGGSTASRMTCLSKELYNWSSSSYSDCYKNDYLYSSSYSQWTLTPYYSYSDSEFFVKSSGSVSYQNASVTGSVRPVGYLVSDAKILSGSGTKTEPWIIGL